MSVACQLHVRSKALDRRYFDISLRGQGTLFSLIVATCLVRQWLDVRLKYDTNFTSSQNSYCRHLLGYLHLIVSIIIPSSTDHQYRVNIVAQTGTQREQKIARFRACYGSFLCFSFSFSREHLHHLNESDAIGFRRYFSQGSRGQTNRICFSTQPG